jgi:hypothetical protein
LTVKFNLFDPIEWPLFSRVYGVGSDDCSTLPAKLHVKGSPIFESFNPDETSPENTILTEEYIITNKGDFPLDWNVDFEADDVLTVSKLSGTGIKDETDTVVVSINTNNITADAISRLLSDKTLGLMDGFISNLRGTSSIYRNVLRFRNTTQEVNTIFAAPTDVQKGHTNISVKVKKLPQAFPTPELAVPTVISATSAQLNWSYNSVEAINILPFLTGFHIAQSQDGVNWEPRESVHGKLLRTYNVTGLTPERTYFFAITAYGEENQSNRSNEVQVTMPALPLLPNPPTNFKAVAGNGEITLSWDAVENATYNVYWKVVESGVQQKISGIEALSFPHTGLTNGTKYSYQVTAVVNGIESTPATGVTSTPLEAVATPGIIDDCENFVEEGSDEPETHVINLHSYTGTFEFKYETFGEEDQIVVEYEGKQLFDTLCIGTNGWKEKDIFYSGNSTQITVRVEPNCDNGSGTQWEFKVSCPQ